MVLRQWFKYFRVVFGCLTLIVLLYLLDSQQILLHILHLEIKWIILAAICIVLSTLIGSLNIYLLLYDDFSIKWRDFLPIYWIGWALSLIVPGQIGDIAGISAILRQHNMSWHISIGRSLVDKLLSLTVTIIFALSGLIFTQIISYRTNYILIILSIFGLFIIFNFIFIKYFQRNFNNKQINIKTIFQKVIYDVCKTIYHNPLLIFINLIFTSLKITLIGLSYWCMFNSINGIDLNMISVILLTAASSVIAYIPISFNGIGTVEITGIYLFTKLDATSTEIFSVYLALRIVVLLLAWIPAGFLAIFLKQPDNNSFS